MQQGPSTRLVLRDPPQQIDVLKCQSDPLPQYTLHGGDTSCFSTQIYTDALTGMGLITVFHFYLPEISIFVMNRYFFSYFQVNRSTF